jgi:hypothetical protein
VIATLLSGCGNRLPQDDDPQENGYQAMVAAYTEYDKEMSNAKFSGGDGTKQSPYVIATPEDLKNLSIIMRPNNWTRTYANAYYVQSKDIDLNGVVWIPIGFFDEGGLDYYEHRGDYAFAGAYDGLGHEIRNMKILIDGLAYIRSFNHSDAQGLFGAVSRQGNPDVGVRNLILRDADIVYQDKSMPEYRSLCGGLVGLIPTEDVTIENCTVASIKINTTALDVGMLVGENYGKVGNSYASGSIEYIALDSYAFIGGGIGENKGYVSDCRTDCKMSVKIQYATYYDEYEMWIGGFVGRNGDEEGALVQAEIENASAAGELSISAEYAKFSIFIHPASFLMDVIFQINEELVFNIGGFVGDNQGQALILNSDANFTESGSGKEYQFNGLVEYIFYRKGQIPFLYRS